LLRAPLKPPARQLSKGGVTHRRVRRTLFSRGERASPATRLLVADLKGLLVGPPRDPVCYVRAGILIELRQECKRWALRSTSRVEVSTLLSLCSYYQNGKGEHGFSVPVWGGPRNRGGARFVSSKSTSSTATAIVPPGLLSNSG